MKATVDPCEPSAFGPGAGHHVCHCLLCLRERRFHRITAKLRSPTERAWMLGFYDYVSTELEPKLEKFTCYKRKMGQQSSI